MGSIPLPALSIHAPQQQNDPVEQYGRILQLRNMMQLAPLQQQEAQQRVQSGQLELQKAQREQQDQQKMSAVMQDWASPKPAAAAADGTQPQASSMPNYDDLLDRTRKAGVSYSTYQALQKQVLDMKDKASTIAKNDAQAGSAQANAIKTKNDMLINAMTGVMQLPDEQLVPGLQSAAQQLTQQGVLDPQHAQMASQLAQMADPAKIRAALTSQIAGMGGFNKLLEDAQKKAQAEQTQGKSDPNSIFYDPSAQSVAMGTAPGSKLIQQGQIRLAAAKAGAEQNARIPGELSLAKQKLALGLTDNGTNLTGDAYLQTLPAGTQAQVKAMANGDIAVPSASARNVQAQALRNAVLTYDPSYTDARYKGKQDFKTKGDAQNVMQLATAMEHADRAISNSADAGFSPAMGNKTIESGTSAKYMQDVEFLTGEVGKLVKNGVLTVDESNKISSGLTSARQSVRDSALKETMDLLGGKSRSLFQKYKNSTGQDLPVNEFFDQKGQQRLQKYGLLEGGAQGAPASGMIRAVDQNGNLHQAPAGTPLPAGWKLKQ
jgi:hypothetical protein